VTAERPLADRVAVVTGGVSGIGFAIAEALAAAGADVAVGSLLAASGEQAHRHQSIHLPTDDELGRARESLLRHGTRIEAAGLDVRCDEACDRFLALVEERLGATDILVNAAGTDAKHPMAGFPDELWHRTIDTNLTGPYRMTKRCLPGMIGRRWGRIVNISSTAGIVGAPNHAAYCASKAALLGLTRCVALEGAPHGVTCNAILPGFVDTPMSRRSQELRNMIDGVDKPLAERHAELFAAYPQHRLIAPGEIGALAAYLCTDEALGITGEALRVSAGGQW